MVRPHPGRAVPVEVHAPAVAAGGVLGAIEPEPLVRPLGEALAPLVDEAAALLDAAVVSIYARERGGDTLVLAGNRGFPAEAIGSLRLRIGDGIVGWVAECLRPISVTAASRDPRWKRIRGLGEEQFPVLAALPIVRRGACLGVLVAQRGAARPFADREIRLAGLLADTAGLVLAAAARGHAARQPAAALALAGQGVSPGLGIGRVEVIPTAAALAGVTDQPTWPAIADALAAIERDLGRLRLELGAGAPPEVLRALARLELTLADTRFRERAAAVGPEHLLLLAREYARAPFRTAAGAEVDPSMLERAQDVEELCVLVHLMAAGSPLRRAGTVWIGQRLGGFFALAATRGAAAVVLDADGVVTAEALAIARARGLPIVAGVAGLFAWTRPGDLLVVDADEAWVRINPSSAAVVAARGEVGEARRRRTAGRRPPATARSGRPVPRATAPRR